MADRNIRKSSDKRSFTESHRDNEKGARRSEVVTSSLTELTAQESQPEPVYRL